MANTRNKDANHSAKSSNAGNRGSTISWGEALAATMPDESSSFARDVVDPNARAEDANGAEPAHAGEEVEFDGEDNAEPFHKHPRWQQMQAKRDAAEKEAAELRAQLEASQHDRKFAQYLRDMGFDSIEALEHATLQAALGAEQAGHHGGGANPPAQHRPMTAEQARANYQAQMAAREQAADFLRQLSGLAEQEVQMHIEHFAKPDRYPDADFDSIRHRALAQAFTPGFDAREFVEKEAKASHERMQTRIEQRMANLAHKKASEKAAPLSTERSVPMSNAGSRMGVPNPAGLPRRAGGLPDWGEALGVNKLFRK